MCHDSSARPPIPPISGGSGGVEGNELVLQAEDGNRFSGYGATADGPGGPGIVILPDVRGLHHFYRELAERFAEAGIHAVAIDYFGRTAGIGERDDDFEYIPHVQQTKPDQIAQDVAAAVAYLRSPEGGHASAAFTVGFCFGGRQSFNQAANDHGLSGVIGFYGAVGSRPPYPEETAPTRLAPRYRSPVLGLFGGADDGIPPESIDQFREALRAAAVPNEIVVYEGARHSFFDRRFAEFRDECEDAWKRMLGFIQGAA